MNSSLRNKLIGAASAGAIAIGGVLITDQEGVKYTPYLDPVGIPTVCAGVTGPDVVMSKTYTKAECDNLLYKHMLPAVAAVDSSTRKPRCTHSPIT
jgi:lysozyme